MAAAAATAMAREQGNCSTMAPYLFLMITAVRWMGGRWAVRWAGGGWEVGSVSPSYTWKVVPSLKITRNFELTFTSPRLSLCVHRSAPGPRPIVLACL